MPNLDPWVNQNNNDYEDMTTKTINKFENHLLSIRAELQKMVHPKSHPTYNEHQQKIIGMIDRVLEKYKAFSIKMMNQENEEQEVIIIEDIIQELNKQRKIAITKKQKALLKDEVLEYEEEEDTIDYILFIIRESTADKFVLK
ncbi:MAG TPA: hypothetical protein VEW92_01380 [Nitrososphaeraceae archaeon]|nr:hypothetical protein [Nitrososphaeraceae archaeon]